MIAAVRGHVPGIHLSDVHPNMRNAAFDTLCGLNNMGGRGNDYGPFGNIRGPGWRVVKTTEVTCRACYEKGKELSNDG